MPKRKRSTAKRALSAAAKRGWATRRANERKRSAAAKRGAETRKRNEQNEAELERIERLLGEDFESLAEARRALEEEKQDVPITITTISQWEELSEADFADGEDEEIVANADY